MVEIKEVKTKQDIKRFIELPLEMYKGNEFFVPPLYSSEKVLFKKKNPFESCSETIFYLAYKEGKLVGRISGIIQKDANAKWERKRVRFTRFDSIDDQEVADALFNAVEKWAKEKGMNEICGPLGYNDLEREGLLLEGFDKLSTFEEQYNFNYYEKLVVNHGFKTEAEWIEKEVRMPKDASEFERFKRISDLVMRKYKLSYIHTKSVPEFVKKYREHFFTLLEDTYSELYGTCPIREEVQEDILSGFKLLLTTQNITGIQNEKGELVAYGLYLPSIAKAVQPSGGRLTPSCIYKILKARKKSDVLDLALIGVRKDLRNCGVPAMLLVRGFEIFKAGNYDHYETNLQLTTNLNIITLFDHFDCVLHKRRRAYVKSI
jgi:hypothetical protein